MHQKRLGDMASYINGYAFKPEQRGKVGLPIIRIQDLTGNAYDLGFYDGDYPKKIEINDGDVLISWSASLGVYEWNRGKALLNQHIFKVVFDKLTVDKKFFMYAVQYKLEEMESKTHGATMKHITKKDFDNTVIPFPTIVEQERISNTLNKLHTIIDSKKFQLEKLDNLIKARFVEMFGGSNCETKKLSEITDIITKGTTPTTVGFEFTNDGVNFFKIESITEDHTINLNKVTHVSDECHATLKRSQLRAGDVLFSIAGAIGRMAIIGPDDLPGNTNQALAIIRLSDDSGISQKYLISALDSPEVFEQCRTKKRGVAQINLSLQDVGNIEIPIPNLDDQKAFESFAKQVDKSKFALQNSIINLMNLWYNTNNMFCERTYGEA